jgi:hypothetical protein
MTNKALSIIQNIGDWYLMEHGTYIRVYGATKAPHLLPRFSSTNWCYKSLPTKQLSMELGWHSIATRKISGPRSHCGLDHTVLLVSNKLKLKWIHCYCMALEKNALGGMTPRKWLENTASRTSTLRVFGKKKKTIVEHGLMMRSLLEGRGSHPPPKCSCKVFLNPLVYGHDYI